MDYRQALCSILNLMKLHYLIIYYIYIYSTRNRTLRPIRRHSGQINFVKSRVGSPAAGTLSGGTCETANLARKRSLCRFRKRVGAVAPLQRLGLGNQNLLDIGLLYFGGIQNC